MTTNSSNINDSGLPIFDSTTGQFSAVQLTTKGDALVYGTNYTRLAVGADEKILKADSTQSSGLAWGDMSFTGDWVLIDQQEVSSASTVDFTDLDYSTYGSFFIRLVNVHPATDAVSLRCLFSIDNGSSYLSSNYSWVYRRFDTGSGTDTSGNSSSSAYIQAAEDIGSAAGEGIAGYFWFLPSSNATQMRHVIEWQFYSQDSGNDLNNYWGGGSNTTSSAVDALRFQFSSGNIEVGNFYLYGLSAS